MSEPRSGGSADRACAAAEKALQVQESKFATTQPLGGKGITGSGLACLGGITQEQVTCKGVGRGLRLYKTQAFTHFTAATETRGSACHSESILNTPYWSFGENNRMRHQVLRISAACSGSPRRPVHRHCRPVVGVAITQRVWCGATCWLLAGWGHKVVPQD